MIRIILPVKSFIYANYPLKKKIRLDKNDETSD